MRSNRDEEREKTNISLSSERRPANRICLLSLSSIEPSRIWARTMSTKSMVQTCRVPLKKVKNENGISRPERNSTSKANFLTKKNELSRQSSEGFRCCRITEWKTTSICLSADSAFSEIEKTSDERAFDLFERFPSARWFDVTTVFFFRSQRISSQMSSVLQEPIGRSTNDRTVLVESSPIVESFSRQETSQIETKLDFEFDWLRPERWTNFAERRWVTELSIDRAKPMFYFRKSFPNERRAEQRKQTDFSSRAEIQSNDHQRNHRVPQGELFDSILRIQVRWIFVNTSIEMFCFFFRRSVVRPARFVDRRASVEFRSNVFVRLAR